jgi:hypothetical protein
MSVIQASFEPSVARETIDADDSVADALDVIARTGQAVLIVTCEGLPIGIVTARELCGESGRVACRRRGPCDEEAMNRRAAAWLPSESAS